MTPKDKAPPFLTVRDQRVLLTLKVLPRASANAVAGPADNELRIRVTAPPVDSAANRALIDFLADKLGCRRGALQIIRGEISRHKTVAITGLTAEEVLQKLLA